MGDGRWECYPKVGELNLASNNLSGLIPQQLGECRNLLHMNNLNKNKFGDSIPFEIVVAVKKVHSTQDDEEMADLITFKSGIEALADVGHHHIVKLCGLCSWASANWTSFAGTFGYTAPAIMGRHPGDLIYYYWHLRRHHPHLHQPSPASVICCGASS
ncbi:hypothetical protein AAG906_011404 [Vitis piasezkii]